MYTSVHKNDIYNNLPVSSFNSSSANSLIKLFVAFSDSFNFEEETKQQPNQSNMHSLNISDLIKTLFMVFFNFIKTKISAL